MEDPVVVLEVVKPQEVDGFSDDESVDDEGRDDEEANDEADLAANALAGNFAEMEL